MKILFVGDIVGKPGREILRQQLPGIQDKFNIDFTIANGENAASGAGINKRIFEEISNYGVDLVTMGNHVWDRKEILDCIDHEERIIRPANDPHGAPGKGWNIFSVNQVRIVVINLAGRVFMPSLDCPFQTMECILAEIKGLSPYVILDFHGEATSEKQAMGWYLDGRVSAVFGTHTHIQTADARILHRGTAYMTDVGMTGPRDSVLGMDKDLIIKKFTTSMPVRFEIAHGDIQLNAVIVELNKQGKTVSITPVNTILESI